jgi:MFS family permease
VQYFENSMRRPQAAAEADVQPGAAEAAQLESTYAWLRLAAAVGLSTIGGAGMWSVVVALPVLQAEFGVARAAASFPYTLTMVCFGLGGVLMGRLADRFGVVFPIVLGIITLGAGYMIAAAASTLWQFSLAQGVLLGLGSSATFAPLLSDTSKWFSRRRGMAVGICASGNYLAGALWPPVVQHFINVAGWRHTYVGIGLFCLVTMLALAVVLRRSAPKQSDISADASGSSWAARPLGLSPLALQVLLSIAGVACCVAMSMPQVHLVAYCADLGYGAARGAEMLSLMLGFGIVSRLTSGWMCDHIGGLRTLLLGSTLQGIALLLFLPFDGLLSLYVIAALFGLFQGGIVPSYAIIIRDYFPPRETGARVGIVIMTTLFGMALGGWMSGAIFDLTGSYKASFVNGLAWNAINVSIAVWLLRRARTESRLARAM